MNANFSVKNAPVLRVAILARHSTEELLCTLHPDRQNLVRQNAPRGAKANTFLGVI
jgi:hypothetical protein